MKSGISTGCWYPDLTENSIEKIKEAGFTNAEIFICDDSETEIEYLKMMKRLLDNLSIKAVSVHPYTSFAEQFLFFSGYSRRQESAYKYYRKYHMACKILEADIINFHGVKTPTTPENYARVYGRLFHEAKEEGIMFCQENVRNFVSGKADFISDLKQISGKDIAFTLDVKQAYMEGENIDEMLKVMNKDIKLVHLSDHSLKDPCLLPGFGSFDIANFIKKLKHVKYDGFIITEVYSQNYKNDTEVRESRIILDNIIKNT